jgi:hypothetical protein
MPTCTTRLCWRAARTIAPPGDHERERLLHVDVPARLAGMDHLQGMPVIRRADDHGIHVFQVEQPA